MNGITSPWTPERDAELRRLFALGLPYSRIGQHLGTTKNAALGRARRLGFAFRVPPVQLETMHRARTVFPPYGHCQWITNDKAPFLFCNNEADGTWCPEHRARVYLPFRDRPLEP